MNQKQHLNEVEFFLATVEGKIKYKPMIPDIKKELLNHIEDKTNNYIENGLTEEQAIYETIKDMGTPEDVSNSFNVIYHTKPTWNSITNHNLTFYWFFTNLFGLWGIRYYEGV